MWWIALIITIIVLLVILSFITPSEPDKEPERKQSYDDDFGDVSEAILPNNKGIWIGAGKIDREMSFRHCCLIAPSGGGKTSGILIPTALELDNCSVVILDLAKEFFDKTARHFQQKGFSPKILDFTSEISIGFNPLVCANTNTELNLLGEALFATATKNSKDAFWPNMAARFTVLMFKIQKKLPVEHQNLGNTLHLITSLQGSPRKVDQLFAKYADDKLFEEYRAMAGFEGKLLSNILATAQSALGIFGDENVAKVTSRNTLNFEEFRKQKIALFIHMNVADAKYLSPLIEIYFNQFFRFCMSRIPDEKKENDIFVLADEAGSFTIPGFPEAIANLRKFRVSLTIAIQGAKSQLVERYGKENAETILANCYHKIVFPGMELSLAKELETRMGKWSFTDEDGRQTRREVITISELIHLEEGTALYIAGPNRPTIITLHPYYENIRMERKTKLSPPKIKGDAPSEVSYIKLPELKVVPKEKAA